MTDPEVVVRERAEADLPACAAALVAVHAVDGYPVEGVDDPKAWLRPAGLIQAWVAELDGRVIGHALITEPGPGDAAAQMWLREHPDDQLAVGGRLFVDPAGRGHGAARRLIDVAAAAAAARGLRIAGDVMTKDVVAIALYDQLSMRRIGTTEHPDGKGQLIPALCYISSL